MSRRTKLLFLLLLLAAASCASGQRVLTMESFSDIPMGATKDEIAAIAGRPYRVNNKPGGLVEYEYIERLKIGLTLEERHYFILLKDGRVVDKRVTYDTTPPFYIDSYMLQMTQQDEDQLSDQLPEGE